MISSQVFSNFFLKRNSKRGHSSEKVQLSTLHEILHSTTLIEGYVVSHFSSTPKSLYRYLEIALSREHDELSHRTDIFCNSRFV
jgi:hypothetical protein